MDLILPNRVRLDSIAIPYQAKHTGMSNNCSGNPQVKVHHPGEQVIMQAPTMSQRRIAEAMLNDRQ